MRKILLSLITLLATFASVSPAFARPVAEFEGVLNLAPRVESRSILPDIERIYPYIAADGTKYQTETVNGTRSRNLVTDQTFCRLVRIYMTQTSDAKCKYASPWT